MKKVKVIGLGAITAIGNSAEEIWEKLNQADIESLNVEKLEYTSVLSGAKKRRINRYSDMAVFTAKKAMDDACATANVGSERIGTIYSTGYGPMVSNLDFAKKVHAGDPDLCSPTVFSGTVSNACVGHVCMNLNCKGASTTIMGSNNIGYSQMLLSKGAVDFILSGAIEEYDEELYDSFHRAEKAKGVKFCESAVSILLAREEMSAQKEYCKLVDFEECDLSAYPVFNDVDEQQAICNMQSVLKRLVADRKIDLVLTADSGTAFGALEQKAIDTVLPQVSCVDNVKVLFGETLGAAFNINALVASLVLKNGCVPKALHVKNPTSEPIAHVLVTGFNVSGSYVAYLFEK